MARKGRGPTVEARTHRCADGSVTETWSVRYYDATGARGRLQCSSREEADFERARLVPAESLGQTAPAPTITAEPARGLTLAESWPVYHGDAEGRLARSTLREYERLWTAASSRSSATWRSTSSGRMGQGADSGHRARTGGSS